MEEQEGGEIQIKVFDVELVQKSWYVYDLGSAIVHTKIITGMLNFDTKGHLKLMQDFVQWLVEGYTDGRMDINWEHLRQGCLQRVDFLNYMITWAGQLGGYTTSLIKSLAHKF